MSTAANRACASTLPIAVATTGARDHGSFPNGRLAPRQVRAARRDRAGHPVRDDVRRILGPEHTHERQCDALDP